MAMGMKMGQLDDIKTKEDNGKNNLNIDDKEKPREEITSKEIKKANEELKNPKLRQQLKWLKVLIEKKLPEEQEKALNQALDNIKKELAKWSTAFSEKGLLMTTGFEEYPHDQNGMIDKIDVDSVAGEIAAHFDANTFKMLKKVITYQDIFDKYAPPYVKEEREKTLQNFQNAVENIWKELQLQDKQQQIDKVKAVTKVTKGK